MDAYLKVDGVTGDVTSPEYGGWIRLESLDFSVDGVSMADAMEIFQGAALDSPAVLSAITVTKRADRASTALFNMSCSGEAINEATIAFIRPGDKGPGVEYMNYELEHVYVSSYSISDSTDSNDNALPLEKVKLVFRTIRIKYTVFDKSGKKSQLERGGFDVDAGRILRG